MSLASVALQCSIAAAGALTVCALRMPIARTMDLLDTPDATRKLHRTVTPLVGGLAVFPAIALACVEAVGSGAKDDAIAILYAVVFGFFLIGYADDRVQIRPSRRLLLTLALFAGLTLMTPGLMPTEFVFGGVAIPLGAGTIALLAIFAASGALNAINMSDGQDGLCTGLLLIWCAFLAASLDMPYASAASITAAGLAVVLLFNLFGLVFLGDIGAFGVGAFVLGLMLAGVSTGDIDHGQIVTLLTVPVVDCVWLMIERKRRGHSPFDPDRQHLHHILQQAVGKWPSLIVYLALVGAGAAAAYFGGWACVAAILAQAAVVSAFRLRGPRVIEVETSPLRQPNEALTGLLP
ncbi:Undecaprenyl-phosphate alpha-N-acetylglucosaminyl 1-phosphate transferase [Alphaproteobacteria bacterium SO-S41]|nr:Undecaprenyl-phosphate alpha-N-acetylglucosaminyl 1-phosphate transferase [Alphaproteobacteria bacterium SO-S41]